MERRRAQRKTPAALPIVTIVARSAHVPGAARRRLPLVHQSRVGDSISRQESVLNDRSWHVLMKPPAEGCRRRQFQEPTVSKAISAATRQANITKRAPAAPAGRRCRLSGWRAEYDNRCGATANDDRTEPCKTWRHWYTRQLDCRVHRRRDAIDRNRESHPRPPRVVARRHITFRCTRSRGPRGFCSQRRSPRPGERDRSASGGRGDGAV